MELLQEFNSNQARSLKDAHRTELNRIQDQHAAEMAGLHHAREVGARYANSLIKGMRCTVKYNKQVKHWLRTP